MIKKILKKIVNIYFYVGTNIIGLPEAHKHTMYLSKREQPKFQPVNNKITNPKK